VSMLCSVANRFHRPLFEQMKSGLSQGFHWPLDSTLDWTVFIFDPPAALHFFHGRGVSRVSRPIEEGLSFYSTRPMSSGGSLDISTRTSTYMYM